MSFSSEKNLSSQDAARGSVCKTTRPSETYQNGENRLHPLMKGRGFLDEIDVDEGSDALTESVHNMMLIRKGLVPPSQDFAELYRLVTIWCDTHAAKLHTLYAAVTGEPMESLTGWAKPDFVAALVQRWVEGKSTSYVEK